MTTTKSITKGKSRVKTQPSLKSLSQETFLKVDALQIRMDSAIKEAFKKKAEESMKRLSPY